jgi:hypothetical protein
MYRVRIKKLPNKQMGGVKTGQQTKDGALSIQPTALGGADIDQYIGKKATSVQKTLQPVAREGANVEVEKGEVVAGDLNGDGMIETYIAGGKRHSQGGTPLNLPDDTFIFSDTASMRIKDPEVLAKFGKTSGSYTPAELAKQYDINKYRKILQDPDSDAVDRKTAELMIKNYTMKLGGLAVAQEGKKAFPQGVPLIAKPLLEANGVSEEQIMPKYQPKFAQQGEEMESEEPQEEVSMDESMPTQMPSGQDIAMSPEMMQQAGMAAYGMQMGGYGMPFAQTGRNMSFDPTGGDPHFIKIDRTPEEIKQDENNPIETAPYKIGIVLGDPKNPQGYYDPELRKYIYSNKAKGGLIKAQEGKSIKPPYKMDEAYTPQGVVRLNTFRKKYGLQQLKGSVTKSDIQKAAGELQAKIAETNPDLLIDYMTTKSHQPNNELKKIIPKGYPATTEGAKQAMADGKLTPDQIKTAYKDNQWWYRALDTQVKELSPEEYEEKMKEPGSIKQGNTLYFNDDPDNPEMYTQYVMKDADKKDETITVPETEEEDVEDVDATEEYDFPQPPVETKAQWMTPDVINAFGAFGDLNRVKKYQPWAPMVDLEEQQARYLDVTRPAAAISEQANIAMQNLAQFTGSPQATAANTLATQAMASKNVADLMSNYNNQNVQIANQLNQVNTGIRNQERLKNQEIASRLYDQNTIMNQQYDNAKTAGRANLRQALTTGWKNASDLAMVNAMSQQYDIDPVTGTVVYQGGKEQTPERANTFNSLMEDYIKAGFEPKDAIAAAKEALKTDTSGSGVDYNAILQNLQYSKDGGGVYVMGSNVFPFMFY